MPELLPTVKHDLKIIDALTRLFKQVGPRGRLKSVLAQAGIKREMAQIRYWDIYYFKQGTGNMPDIMFKIELFYSNDLSNEALEDVCERFVLSIHKGMANRYHIIAKATAGNLHGFAEVNKPEK